jgi:hypothetical protein
LITGDIGCPGIRNKETEKGNNEILENEKVGRKSK